MKQSAYPLSLFVIISLYATPVAAQEKITGVVLDAGDRTTLVGVSVQIEHRETFGTATGIDGSFESAKQALSPGVTVNNESGKVGFNVDLNTRGISSINASQQPLYIIDGTVLYSKESITYDHRFEIKYLIQQSLPL